ncbi:MAG: hypothetical protein AAF960_30165 [Bacteroidota bacterium]
MSVLEIKNDLLRLVVETNDAEFLRTVRNYFKVLKKEPISDNELLAQETKMIELGLKQIEENQVTSDDIIREKINARLEAKGKSKYNPDKNRDKI